MTTSPQALAVFPARGRAPPTDGEALRAFPFLAALRAQQGPYVGPLGTEPQARRAARHRATTRTRAGRLALRRCRGEREGNNGPLIDERLTAWWIPSNPSAMGKGGLRVDFPCGPG